MNFQVPQFIEIENKIFGPLSFSQFIFVAGGTALAFLWYVILPNLYFSLIPILLSVGAGLGLAFYKINNRSLIYVLQSVIKYYLSNKLYLWQKDYKTAPKRTLTTETNNIEILAKSSNRLEELSWKLDVKDKIQ